MLNGVRLTHVITGLGLGGAERTLLRITLGLKQLGFEQTVISLTSTGPIASQLTENGIPVVCLDLKRGLRIAKATHLLARELALAKPEVIQSWMYHADYLAACTRPPCPLVWGIRNSTLAGSASKPLTRWVRGRCASLSHSAPTTIVSCSHKAAQHHIEVGYNADKFQVIPNGIDTHQFSFDNAGRSAWRAKLNIPDQARVFVHPARFHPQKGHADLLEAIQQVLQFDGPPVYFLLVGSGVSPAILANRASLLSGHVNCLGPIDDMRGLYSAGDFVLMASISGEAFPNVLAEAMACGRPCIGTDVGDAEEIMGDSGLLVPPGRPPLLADAIQSCRMMSRDAWMRRSEAGKHRIQTEFELEQILNRYAALYERLAGRIPCAA